MEDDYTHKSYQRSYVHSVLKLDSWKWLWNTLSYICLDRANHRHLHGWNMNRMNKWISEFELCVGVIEIAKVSKGLVVRQPSTVLCLTHIIHAAKNHLTFTCMKSSKMHIKHHRKEKNCVVVKTYDRLPTIIINIIYFGLWWKPSNGLDSMTAFRLK